MSTLLTGTTVDTVDARQLLIDLFTNKADILPDKLPIPFPYYLVEGFDLQNFDNDSMSGKNAVIYWMGEWVKGPVHMFFPFLFLTKLTLPLLLLFLYAFFKLVKELF